MLCAAASAADGLCASSAEAIRRGGCDRADARSGSGGAGMAASGFTGSGGGAAITLGVEVMMITANTSRKLPNVSWPIDNENDRVTGEFGGNSEVMLLRPGSNRT